MPVLNENPSLGELQEYIRLMKIERWFSTENKTNKKRQWKEVV